MPRCRGFTPMNGFCPTTWDCRPPCGLMLGSRSSTCVGSGDAALTGPLWSQLLDRRLFLSRLDVDGSIELHEFRLFLQERQVVPRQEVRVCFCFVLQVLVEVVDEPLELMVLVHVDHLRLVLSEEPVEVGHVSHLLVGVPRSGGTTCTARRTRTCCAGSSSGRKTSRSGRACCQRRSSSQQVCYIIISATCPIDRSQSERSWPGH